MWRAPVMWPELHSAASRTSSTSASSRFISRVACAGVRLSTPPPATIGHSSMPPLTKASATQIMFSCTNSIVVYSLCAETPQNTSRIMAMS